MALMVYQYLVKNGLALTKKLISEKIFVATFWPNVLNFVSNESLEYHIAKNTVFYLLIKGVHKKL